MEDITLQYCDGFCHTSTRISHRYTCILYILNPLPPPLLPYPSGLPQSTSCGCPASCIKLTLVIYFTYGNVHVSVLFSQIIPPSPSPSEPKSLFFASVSPLLLCMRISGSVFSKFHVYVLIYSICLSLSDLLHSV